MSSDVTVVSFKVEAVAGAQTARILTVAVFALTVYEYFLTLDNEKRYFWTSRFSLSHALFYFNRYVPACIIIHAIVIFSVVNPSLRFCALSIQASFLLNIFAIGIIQAILITRVWFLFPGNKSIQVGLIFSFASSVVASLIFVYMSANQLVVFSPSPHNRTIFRGCSAKRPPGFWRIYLPSLILHTLLYALTAYQAITSDDRWRHKSLRKRIIRDGSIFYFIVLCCVGFTSVGSMLAQVPQINVPAIFSPIALATLSLATTRIIFSLREVAISDEPSFEFQSWPPATLDRNHTLADLAKGAQTSATARSVIPMVEDEEKGEPKRDVYAYHI